jgi:CO/xanthine dehydrogenase Mo-binding subunit
MVATRCLPLQEGLMAENKLIGRNYTPLDLVAKVTGRARYAEDFRAAGMLFCKLLLSPMPHARVKSVDVSAALAMPGVKAILRADDLPKQPHYGVSLARRFHHSKRLTILDVPVSMQAVALDIPDPETPVAKGVGEPPVGAGYGAVLNAIADAVGVDVFRRTPVTADIVLMSLEHGKPMHEPLRAHL